MQDLAFFAKGISLVLLALAAGAFLLGRSQAAHASDLQREGVRTSATVTERYVRSGARPTSAAEERRQGVDEHRIRYSFQLQDGREHTTDESLPEELWRTVTVGQELKVTYLPRDPDVATVLDGGFEQGAALLSMAWKLLLGLGAVCLAFGIVAGRKPKPPAASER